MTASTVPAKYIINSYFRDITSINSPGIADDHHPCQIAIRSKTPAAAYEAAIAAQGNKVIRFNRKPARKFDKSTEFDVLYVQAEKFIRSRDGISWEMGHDAIVLRRSHAIIRPRKIDYYSVPAGLMLTRHTLERIYERNELDNDTFRGELKNILAEIEQRFSYAIACNLFAGGNCHQARANTMIPVEGGLIIFNNTSVILENKGEPFYGVRVIPNGHYAKQVLSDSQFQGKIDLWGVDTPTYVIAYGATYISNDIMDDEQRAYVMEFEQEYAKHNSNENNHRLGQHRYIHQKQSQQQSIKTSARLRYLASINARRQPSDIHMAIGWHSEHKTTLEKVIRIGRVYKEKMNLAGKTITV